VREERREGGVEADAVGSVTFSIKLASVLGLEWPFPLGRKCKLSNVMAPCFRSTKIST